MTKDSIMSVHLRQEVIEVCKKLYDKGWLAACDGNVSVRLDESTLLITPSGKAKGHLLQEELVLVDLDGKSLDGLSKPSSEIAMHVAVYKNAPRARAVIHAHPPLATAWSIARKDLNELPSNCCSEVILATGSIPIVPYARPGTPDMGTVLLPYLPQSKVMVLANHGSLTWGDSLEEAFFGTERLEHIAKTLFYAQVLGGLHELPPEEIHYLTTLREKMGNKTL